MLYWQHHRVLIISVLTAAAIIAAAVVAVIVFRGRGVSSGDVNLPTDLADITEYLTEFITDRSSEDVYDSASAGITATESDIGDESNSATNSETEIRHNDVSQTDAAATDRVKPETQSGAGVKPRPDTQQKPQTAAPPKVETEPPTLPTGREEILRSMTLREKVYQLFVVFPIQISDEKTVISAGEAIAAGLQRRPVGGVLYDASNMMSKEQVARLLADMQSYSKIPLITSCDEEGGRVGRLMNTVGTTKLDPMLSYRSGGAVVATKNARTIAADMRGLGFNLDFAPVADVWSNPANSVIGDRAYSDDYNEAATLISAAVRGFHEGGVSCTLKHFPGHGDTSADTHTGAAYVTKTLDELRRGELLPFQAGIDAGADAVMIGHLTVTAVSNEPALFSHEIVTDLLRREMGFSGVVITDGLRMGALSGYSDGEVAVRAVKAGVDILLCPRDLDAAAEGLIAAVGRGEISEARINESVLRILRMKGF